MATRRKLPRAVDPIEANALRGGRMAMRESLLVCLQTLISNGSGASVGLEAGYAQIGGAIASRLGVALRLRRQDLRMLVGCGAGGAIAAAFGAPLTGAFYASELIIGAYSLANAGPIFAAALAATLTTKALLGAPYVSSRRRSPRCGRRSPRPGRLWACSRRRSASARCAPPRCSNAALRRRARRSGRARPRRPYAGGDGALYAADAGAGHGALGLDFSAQLSAATLATLLVLKLSASLVSLASGFRGGLFFASLFAGALLGKLYALGVAAALPALGLDPTACILAGMATLSVAVVGGPLTMTFLVLESSGDLGVAGGVLAASIATSLAVRPTFGYSFTTWLLHLRGESIRGAQDIGWQRELTVAKPDGYRDPAIARAAETLASPNSAPRIRSAARITSPLGRRSRALRWVLCSCPRRTPRRWKRTTTAARFQPSRGCRKRACIPTSTCGRRWRFSTPRRPTRSP